jgi:Flp pilus assembly secretin CpaC
MTHSMADMRRLAVFACMLFGFVVGPKVQAVETKPLIQIGVEVVEVDEQKSINLGIQWMSSLHVSEQTAPSLFQVGTFTRDAIFADLQFMEQNGAADLLANPKLVARDGASATFHAGGEIPYATAASLGTVTVVFKPYGVDLKVTPHLNDQKQIELSVDAEVSSPDDQNAVTLSGNVVPGIRSRKATSELILAPGSTLTMAGLLQNDKEWIRTGVPILMHIPLLKYLFSHKNKVLRKTSVVIFVTPTLIDAPKAATALNPTDPDDGLLGIEEKKDMELSHG